MEYWDRIRQRAEELHSDGCTGVPEFYHDCCLEHDIHCRTGETLDGTPITRKEADAQFRRCIQNRSMFGCFSPLSWWRWVGVRIGAMLT